MAQKPKKDTRQRITVDISEIVADIDEYPEQHGIPSKVWNSLTYAQKILYLAKEQLGLHD